MANLVLYRKYRPKTFSEVIGQEHIVKTITNAIVNDLLSHSYFFSGPKGSGKTTLARLLAKRINCENPQKGEPCNKCSSCLEINSGRAIDILEIDAASNRGIDDIRELREGIKFSPTRLKYKVFIIDESHQLSRDAANALLKVLEEPPSFVVFILATTEAHKMIPTIISRCQRFDFRKLTLSEITEKLEWIAKQEKIKIEKSAIELIAMNSEGAMRNAEVLLDQCLSLGKTTKNNLITAEDIKDLLGVIDVSLVAKLINLIFQKESGEAINFLNKSIEKGIDPSEFIKAIVDYLRQALILSISPDLKNPIFDNLTEEVKKQLKLQVKDLKETDIRRALKFFLDAQNKIRYSSIPQLPIELAILEIIGDK
ncbi:MAG: DNA polymerase III subunit gamma/tau [Patescibacteria group bacterium]|nr:DNA polymerase III subunit gamma/tau [Patescibacteria group bacterium]